MKEGWRPGIRRRLAADPRGLAGGRESPRACAWAACLRPGETKGEDAVLRRGQFSTSGGVLGRPRDHHSKRPPQGRLFSMYVLFTEFIQRANALVFCSPREIFRPFVIIYD